MAIKKDKEWGKERKPKNVRKMSKAKWEEA